MTRTEYYLPLVDATASVELWPTSQGGRPGPYGLTDRLPWLGCPLFVDGVDHGFDVRMEPESFEIDTLLPGETYQMQLKFLDPETAVHEFTPGRAFTLWSGGTIGTGAVREAPFASLRPETT